MNEEAIITAITQGFEVVETVTADDNLFFFSGSEHKFPFATLMTNDVNDNFSNLSRPSVYRLNIGVSKQTFQALFGQQPRIPSGDAQSNDQAPDDGTSQEYDFTAFDTLMPHPVYGRQYWLSILCPSQATFQTQVWPLLAEAYEMDVAKHAKRAKNA